MSVHFQRERKGSNVSNRSNHSALSTATSVVSGASSSMRRMFGPRSTTHSVAQLVDLQPGDFCETISLVTMREAETLESDTVAELPVGMCLEVLQIGQGRRIKVKSETFGEVWISSKTRINEALVVKSSSDLNFVIEDFEAGGEHEVKSIVTMRQEESLDSLIIAELKPGAKVKIKEMGTENNRRAKIEVADIGEGWISVCTKSGEVLLGKVTHGKTSGGGGGMVSLGSSKIKELLEAACANEVETIQKLVQRSNSFMRISRLNLNASDIRGKTALIYASAFGHTAVVAYLLSRQKEVDVNARDDTQKSALHHACKRVKNRRSEECDDGQAEIVGMLLEADADLEGRDHNGCTAIMFATANSISEVVVQRLLTFQANINVADYEGHTPLDYAVHTQNDRIAKLLRANGAAETVEDNDDLQSTMADDLSSNPSGKDSLVDPSIPTLDDAHEKDPTKDQKDKKHKKDKPEKTDKKKKEDTDDKKNKEKQKT